MLRPASIALVNQRRTLRALYAQTQAYPYAANLTTGVAPTGTESMDSLLLSDGVTSGVGIFPGAVLELTAASAGTNTETVHLPNDTAGRPFGLSANFVGGKMDELNGRTEIGVWRGRGGVFEVLAPVFSSVLTGTDDLGGSVAANAAGQLIDVDTDDSTAVDLRAARLINFMSERAIIIELTVGG